MCRRTLGLVLMSWALAPPMGSIAVAHAQQPAAPTPLVFDGVTVIDVQQGRRLPAQRVVIIGDRIRSVGSMDTVRMPAGARVVEAKGKYLIPGLWDMHTHSGRFTDVFYPLFIANGVTGIRDAGSPVPLDTLRLWRQEILAGIRVGPPRQLLSGQSVSGPEPGCQRSALTGSPQTCVADSADARHYVDSLKTAGADMIKPRDVSRELWFVIAAEARRLGIPFGGHAQSETPIEASDSGARIIDHMQYKMGELGLHGLCWASEPSTSIERCQPVAERFKRNGTWLVPTLMVYALLATDRNTGFSSQTLITHFGERTHQFLSGSMLRGNWLHDSVNVDTKVNATSSDSHGNMRVMQSVGLPILAGTDVSSEDMQVMLPGFTLLMELAMYGAEGMTPLEALQTATLNPAKFLHGTDSLGTVAPGKLADLVLLDADPLADITNTTAIRAVVANGRYFDRVALDQLLAGVQARRQAP